MSNAPTKVDVRDANANDRDAVLSAIGVRWSKFSDVELSALTSNDELVKAYRRQLSRNHPDKLKANGLPESMIEHAKQRTQQIIEAYELIRERRGI